MPLGIVTDSEFEKQLPNTNKVVGIIAPAITPGRKPDVPNTPDVVRKFIAEEALNGNDPKVIADALQVSTSSISAYKNGATSTASYNNPEPQLKQHTNRVRSQIATKARNRLKDALNGITPEKLADVKARDLAGIAKDMSAVIKNIEPQESEVSKTQFIFYSPRLREESDYPVVIDVNP